MSLTNSFVMRYIEVKLVSITSSHSLSLILIKRLSIVMPALFTNTETLPYSLVIFSFKALNEKITSEYGKVSVLVNNAGITMDNLLIRMSDKEWDDVIDTNLTSIYRITKEFVKDMMKDRYGRVINIGLC